MVPMTTRQKYDVVPMSYDGLTMALRRPRCTRELNTKLNHRVSFLYFWHVKDFGAARDGDADGLKSLPMDIRCTHEWPDVFTIPAEIETFHNRVSIAC